MRNARLALIYWTRSSKQANVDSLIKMGDYYLSGTGTPVDAEKASTCYHNAAEAHHSAQGYWNLGWMHENGVAVEQDFHMAKRYYDLALDLSPEAYLPVKLSLIKLRIRGYWNRITNGDINPIREEEGKPSPLAS
jgi:SEL1 protein